MCSRLFYHGMDIEVQLGDRVEVYFLCLLRYRGNVSYIPGISEKNRFLEYEECRQWAITSDSGTTYASGYFPDIYQPNSNIRFVCRQEGYVGVTPDMVLDEEYEEDNGKTSSS